LIPAARQFKPDFLVWRDKYVVAIDTKGDHLIVEDSARKLFEIPAVEEGTELVVRLVTEGEWHVKGGTPEKRPGAAACTRRSAIAGSPPPPCRTWSRPTTPCSRGSWGDYMWVEVSRHNFDQRATHIVWADTRPLFGRAPEEDIYYARVGGDDNGDDDDHGDAHGRRPR
jgi:hypothetical protein